MAEPTSQLKSIWFGLNYTGVQIVLIFLGEFYYFYFYKKHPILCVFVRRYSEGWGYRWGRLIGSSGNGNKTQTIEKNPFTIHISCNVYLNTKLRQRKLENFFLVQFFCQSSAPLWISRSSISEQTNKHEQRACTVEVYVHIKYSGDNYIRKKALPLKKQLLSLNQ